MNRPKKVRVLPAWFVKLFMTCYPPLVFNGVRPLRVSKDFMEIDVKIKKSLLNYNLNGTIFGGTILCASDPWFGVMLWQIFAHRKNPIQVWVKSASVDFLKPGNSDLMMKFRYSHEEIQQIENILVEKGKYVGEHRVEAINKKGEVCAIAKILTYAKRLQSSDEDQGGIM
ncbi:MAG: DUF4442 domain-containing protein [Bacteroidia bacterium]|nr:DUF4442 domain-containing protein [Bacteroidia bacterium]